MIFDIICPLCNRPMVELNNEVWYCEIDDCKLVMDASGK